MATKENTAVPAIQGKMLPASINMEQDSNIGRETLSSTDMAIPFISILQALSPQVKKGPNKILDAEEGDLFNTVSQEVWGSDTGVMVIPCAFVRSYVEWAPRESGGGYQGAHDETILQKCTRNERGQDVLASGNLIVLTNYHYCLVIDENENLLDRVVIPFSSTMLKKSRRWNSQMLSLRQSGVNGIFNPPMFSHKYRVTSEHESNNKGAWYSPVITNNGLISNGVTYLAAKMFAQDVTKGLVKVVPTEAGVEEEDHAEY